MRDRAWSPSSTWTRPSRSGRLVIVSTLCCGVRTQRLLRTDMDLVPSPSQTIGPFFHCYLAAYGILGSLAGAQAKGERIRLAFRVLDGDGAPLNDAMLELWQADIGGFGRLPTDEQGACMFESVKPGRVAPQAPHINVSVFA